MIVRATAGEPRTATLSMWIQKASESATSNACCESNAWRFRQLGQTCGFAPPQMAIFKPRAGMRVVENNIATTSVGEKSGMQTNWRALRTLPRHFRRFGDEL